MLSGIQAIVLAGGSGSRLTEIRGDRAKCLLNVGPYPLLFYPLNLLQNHGFKDAIVVVLEAQKNDIQQCLDKTGLRIKVELVTIPTDNDFGTAESLKLISDKIHSDILVLSCDVITNANLHPMVKCFREHNASLVSLLINGGQEKGFVLPGPKSKYKPERDLIGLHPESNRLLFLAALSDFEDRLTVTGHLLRKHGRMTIHGNLLDGHVYLMRKWMVDYLVESKSFDTIKGELLPFIVRKQMSRPKASFDHDNTEAKININDDDIFNFAVHSELESKTTEMSLFNDNIGRKPYHADVIRCYGHLCPRNTFGLRVNTLTSFWAANQKVIPNFGEILGGANYPIISPLATVQCTQMTACAIADGATVAEKTSLKGSTIGSNSIVNPKSRITDSVLMSNVTVEEGVVIENCIICDKVTVKKGAILKSCLIGPGFVVPEGSCHEKQHLGGWDGFIEIE